MKALAKHILRDTLRYALKHEATDKQMVMHSKSLIEEHVKSKEVRGILETKLSAMEYQLELMKAVQANFKEVCTEKIDELTIEIEGITNE